MVRIIFAILALSMSAITCSAASENRVALVIGNSNYQAVPGLPNATRDADLIAQTLRDTGISDVTLAKDLDRDSLIGALREFGAKADAADWAVIYYAGHGIEVAGENYLIPTDAKLASTRDISFETVSLEQVLQTTENARTLSLIFLDACRDNPFAAKIQSKDKSRSIGRGLAAVEPTGATAVFYSAKGGTTAADGDGLNSPFAQALAKELVTPGLEINMLFRRVRQEVYTSTYKEQEPFVYGSLPPTEFFFIPSTVSYSDQQVNETSSGADSTAFEMLGLRFSPLNEQLKRARRYHEDLQGLAIDQVLPEFGEEYTAKVAAGDILVEVNQEVVKNAEDLERVITRQRNRGKSSLLLLANPEGMLRFETLREKE